MESTQNLHRLGHRLRRQESRTKNAIPETRDFAVFVEGAEPTGLQASNLKPDGVRTDIDRGKRGHGKPTVYMPAPKIATGLWIRFADSGFEGTS
jgi:hypothetical protein